MIDPRLAQLAASPLPALRQDLRVSQSAPREDGGAGYVVYDPLLHRYHELDQKDVLLLSLWRDGETFASAAAALAVATGETIDLMEIVESAQEFDRLGLLATPMAGPQATLKGVRARHQGALRWLLHNYLFMRWPLIRPQGFLQATLPFARAMASKPAIMALVAATLWGLYLTSRQWDQFHDAFVNFLTWEGAAGYLVALVGVKILHEFGHGWAAAHYGCRVPTMGVALMVLTPVLYTDVTDAWRLKSRKQRLVIDAAGVAVELAIAGIATLLWAILPDGPARSAVYFIGAVSWTMSLLINLSPLMRFDAYYMLSDALAIPNLQPRAFALMRWALRELLFDLRRPCPEDWSARKRAFIIAYAAAATIYRLVLFLGIAALVYHFAFKLLGIVLFFVEIIWFVLRPIWEELRAWVSLRTLILRRSRSYASMAAALALVAAATTPLPERVEIEAVLEPRASHRLTAIYPAMIDAIERRPGVLLKQGDVVMRLSSPLLARDLERARAKLALNQTRLARRAADAEDRAATLVLEREERSLRAQIASLEQMANDLVIRSPADGTLVDMSPELAPGRWVARGEELGAIISGQGMQLRGYAADHAASRLSPGALGRFIPDDITQPSRQVRLKDIAATAATTIEIPYLTTTNAGRIAVNQDRSRDDLAREDRLKAATPSQAQVLTLLEVSDEADGHTSSVQSPLPILRGLARMDASAESYAARALRHATAVLIRETGF